MCFNMGLLNHLIISGIPEVIGHDQLEEKCIVVLNSIKDNKINERDIAACHRLGKKNDTIIRFLNRKDAEDCLDNRKKLQNFNREACGLGPDVKLFVNQNLSPYMAQLAYYCRVLKREGLIERVTTFKGVVKVSRLISPNGTQRTHVIAHKQDIVKFVPNLDDILAKVSK